MPSTQGPIRIGELLTQSGLLKERDLSEAIQLAGETGLPVGRVLVMSGFLAEHELQASVLAQSLIKDGLLDVSTAVSGLKLAAEEGITIEKALAKLGWKRKDSQSTNKMGELLLAAGFVTKDQLVEALKTSAETGLPLGRILVLTGALSESMLAAVLNAQVFIRDGKVNREQAIKGLKTARMRNVGIEQCFVDHGYYRLPARQTIKLGELLVLAGLLSESDLMNVLEIGLVNQRPLGEVLTQSGYITSNVLTAALRFQEMVASGTLSPLQAAEALGQVHAKGVSIAQSVAELGLLRSEPHETIRLGELLALAGFVTADDITKAVELSSKNSALIGKMLLVTGMIDEPTLHAALRCQFLLREGFLKPEQAIIALNLCARSQISFDDALSELGWTMPTRLKKEDLVAASIPVEKGGS